MTMRLALLFLVVLSATAEDTALSAGCVEEVAAFRSCGDRVDQGTSIGTGLSPAKKSLQSILWKTPNPKKNAAAKETDGKRFCYQDCMGRPLFQHVKEEEEDNSAAMVFLPTTCDNVLGQLCTAHSCGCSECAAATARLLRCLTAVEQDDAPDGEYATLMRTAASELSHLDCHSTAANNDTATSSVPTLPCGSQLGVFESNDDDMAWIDDDVVVRTESFHCEPEVEAFMTCSPNASTEYGLPGPCYKDCRFYKLGPNPETMDFNEMDFDEFEDWPEPQCDEIVDAVCELPTCVHPTCQEDCRVSLDNLVACVANLTREERNMEFETDDCSEDLPSECVVAPPESDDYDESSSGSGSAPWEQSRLLVWSVVLVAAGFLA